MDYPDKNWQDALNRGVRAILKHPQGVVCKHWALAKILQELEEAGYPQYDGFVQAVVRADDIIALTYSDIFEKEPML